MPVLERRHDLCHPVEGDTAWSESYYFNAYDAPTDTGIYTRIGIRPNEGTIDVGMSIWLPDGRIGFYHHVREQKSMIDSDLQVGGVRYSMIEPLQSWRITMDAEASVVQRRDGQPATRTELPLAMDVTFDALAPAFGTDGQGKPGEGASAATGETVGKGHLEQPGRWTGGLSMGGTSFDWTEARGNRDKSWGPRRWGGPRSWRWFSINIDDATHFGGIVIGTEAGNLHRGWVWRDGAHASIREWKVTSDLEDDGVTHRATHVTATDKHDRVHELHATILRVVPGRAGARPDTTVVNEGLARWEYDGRVGYGISEYLHQLDGNARPVVPID